jgi:hypothetical protein
VDTIAVDAPKVPAFHLGLLAPSQREKDAETTPYEG